jgi:hypothetical protein
MGLDFNKIFGISARYPLKKDAYILFFAVQLVFAVAGWFVTAYFGADVVTAEGIIVPETLIPFLLYIIPITIVNWIVMAYLIPAYIDNSTYIGRAKAKNIKESFDVSRKRFLPLIGLGVILGLVMLACLGGVILTIIAVPVITSIEGITMLAVGGVWFFIGLIASVIIFFMTCISPVFCVLEKTGPLKSIKKSWKLVGKNKFNTFLFLLLFAVIYIVISFAGSMPEIIYYGLTGADQVTGVSVQGFVFMLIRTLFTTYLTLFMLASITVYYLSLKKGSD